MKTRLALLSCAIVACRSGPEPSEPVVQSRCVAPPRPDRGELVDFVPVFEHASLDDGIDLLQHPTDTDRWYIATKPGVVYTFTSDDTAPSVFLDISANVEEGGEAGLLALAFHPDFATNGALFLSYTTPGGGAFVSRVGRFVSADGGITAAPATETEVISIQQPYSNHNGGEIAFGPDGMLYFGLGDGGAGSDPQGNGQNTDTLLGSMLRLDVDVDPADGYASPVDNPFASGGGRPEIYAWGLRNPWRFSFDRETGELWLGDVGQNLWEEVDIVRRGGNYGWNIREGSGCFGEDTCATADLVAPVVQYRNPGSASVIGGYVYRGNEIPALAGRYIYSDFYLGTTWSVQQGETPVVVNRGDARRFSTFAQDATGELYGLAYGGGVYKMVAAAAHQGPAFPVLLSQTGCVDLQDPKAPPPGAIAYEVNVPFWSDGSEKQRFIAVPSDATAQVESDGDLTLPEGTVLIKGFAAAGSLIETRLLVRHPDGWAGYSYAWTADGSDAEVVFDGRVTEDWLFPDGQACSFCHSKAAGGSLGLEVGQLTSDSLAAFVQAGILGSVPTGEPLPDPHGSAALGERARAYLHVNCSQCHREDGPQGRARLDLRHDIAMVDTGLCDREPRAGNVGLQTPGVLVDGDANRSVLSVRMHSLGSVRMPPVGSRVVDDEGAALVDAWIASAPCP